MTPLTIYLTDLTYTTLSIAAEAFPLNVGYVASYCKKKFGNAVDITLFKYIDDLEKALIRRPPDLLGMSNYPWNHNLGLTFFRMVEALSPKTIRVMGGPNLPLTKTDQHHFMIERPLIDYYCLFEGEEPFANLIEKLLADGLDRKRLASKPLVEGMLFRSVSDGILVGDPLPRRINLDDIPSPYLTGLLDKFFDDKLSPLLETNRGCPFSCTFCHEGNPFLSKVHYFGLERALAEIDYIADHVTPNVVNLMFADPNFGMMARDQEICAHISTIQKRNNWPKWIFASTGKNKPERIKNTMTQLAPNSMRVWLSVQSMDEVVLEQVKRSNIKIDKMVELGNALQTAGLPTMSELILGLPGDSFDRHIGSISKLIEANVTSITTYTLMLLNGTDLNSDQSRLTYQLKTGFRVLPRDFGQLKNGDIAAEIEEVVIGTSTLPFEDYLRLRLLHLVVNVIYNNHPFAPLFRFFRQHSINLFQFLFNLVERMDQAPDPVREIADSFVTLTRNELWDSKEVLLDFIQQPENYEKYKNGELGTNLIQSHQARSQMVMEAWCQFVFDQLRTLSPPPSVGAWTDQLADLECVCRCRVSHLWNQGWETLIPETQINTDIPAWMAASDNQPLDDFRLANPMVLQFPFSDSQKEERAKYLKRFGDSPTGIGRIVIKLGNLWRGMEKVSVES